MIFPVEYSFLISVPMRTRVLLGLERVYKFVKLFCDFGYAEPPLRFVKVWKELKPLLKDCNYY